MAKRIKANGWHHQLFHSKLPWWAVAVGVVLMLGAALAADYGIYRVNDYLRIRANDAMNASVIEQKRIFDAAELAKMRAGWTPPAAPTNAQPASATS